MKGKRSYLAAALASVLVVGCTASGGEKSNTAPAPTPTPTLIASIAPSAGGTPTPATTAPTISPNPSPDRVSDARAIIKALGGDPTGDARIGTEEFQAGLVWPSVTIDDGFAAQWLVAWSDDGQVAYVFNQAATVATPGPNPLTKAEAVAGAETVLKTLKVQTLGLPAASFDSIYGWSVNWSRTEDGVPVDMDYVAVYFNLSGQLTQYTRIWRHLAPKPSRILTAQQALAKVAVCKAGKKTASPCEKPRLEWFQTADGPEPLKLCWLFGAGRVGFEWRSYAVDAGTGEVFDTSVAGPF